MGAVGGKGPAERDDIVGMTMRPAFRGWPWRLFREVTPDIVEIRLDPSFAGGALRLRDFLRDDGASVSVLVGVPDRAADAQSDHPAAADAPLTTVLNYAADLLNRRDDKLCFPRTRLLGYLAALTVERAGRRELSYGLVKALRRYWRDPDSAVAQDGSFLPAVIRSAGSGLAPMAAEAAARLLRPKFSLWFWGFPGLGKECRWLRRQRGKQSFRTFTLGLTAGPEMPAAEVEFLAVRALLEDLRVAYQPHLWRRKSWRVRRPVLLLDPPGDDLPRLLDRARRQAPQAGDKPSPLLVLIVPEADQDQPASSPRPFVPVRVPEQLGQPGQQPYRPARPWLARLTSVTTVLGIPVLVLVLGLGLIGGSAPRPQAATQRVPACLRVSGSSGGNHIDVARWKSPEGDLECVGYIDYSGTSPIVFSNPGQRHEFPPQQVQDRRIEFDQRAIFAENAQVDQESSGRTVVELVYFAGLTEGANEDYDAAEAEELEGLYAAQKAELAEENAPLLKVVVANGGSKMLDAVPVADMLVSLFRKDSQLIGVVGMDRSITPVQAAIRNFSRHQIPVVATTLSADGIGKGSPAYFQISPSNTQEAALILRYIQQVVPLYFKQRHRRYNSGDHLKPTRITVYEPPPYSEVTDSLGHREKVADLYTISLVRDLKRLAPDYPGITDQVRPPFFIHKLAVPRLCGSSTVDIYAGRHDRPLASKHKFDDFTLFLRTIATDCSRSQQPFIIADDGVTRFIADPAARNQLNLGNVVISYVTKGIAIMRTRKDCLSTATIRFAPSYQYQFCKEYASIASQLLALPGVHGQGLDLLWTGERVGLSWDAGMLFMQAVQNYEKDHSGPPAARDIPAEFESAAYQGVTGSVRFTRTSHLGTDAPDGMPLTIVRIHLSSPTGVPLCAYPGPDGQVFGLVPPGRHCPDGYL